MGINTGMVVVGKIGGNLRMHYTAVGNTTNLAARLQQHAEPGAIRVSEATHRAALPYFEFTALGNRVLWLEGRALSLTSPQLLAVHRDPEALFRDRQQRRRDAGLEQARACYAGAVRGQARAPEIVPYVATVLALEMTGEYARRVQYLDAQVLGRQVFLSMRQLFERLAQRQPLLLVMEDWHWVNHSSVALCEHLLPLTSSGLLFWFVTRAEPGDPAAHLMARR